MWLAKVGANRQQDVELNGASRLYTRRHPSKPSPKLTHHTAPSRPTAVKTQKTWSPRLTIANGFHRNRSSCRRSQTRGRWAWNTPWQTIAHRVRSYKNQHIPQNNWDLTPINYLTPISSVTPGEDPGSMPSSAASAKARRWTPDQVRGDGVGVGSGQNTNAKKINPQYMGRFRSGMPRPMASVAVGNDAATKICMSVSLAAMKYRHNKDNNIPQKTVRPKHLYCSPNWQKS